MGLIQMPQEDSRITVAPGEAFPFEVIEKMTSEQAATAKEEDKNEQSRLIRKVLDREMGKDVDVEEVKVNESDKETETPTAKEIRKSTEAESEDEEDKPVEKPSLSPKTEAIPQEIRVIKAKDADGNTLDLKADVSFIQKVDGKPTKVSLQTLLDDYSGRESWKKEMQKRGSLESWEKKLQSEKETQQTVLKALGEAIKGENQAQAIVTIARLTGQDPLQVLKSYRNKSLEYARQLSELTPDELRVLEAEEEKEYHKTEADRLRKSQETETQRAAVSQEIERVMKQYEFPDLNTFGKVYQEVRKLHIAGELPNIEVLKPEHIGQYYYVNAILPERSAKIVADVWPEKAEDEELLKGLVDAVIKYNLTAEEVKEYVSEMAKEEKAAAQIRTESKSKQSKSASDSKETKQKKGDAELGFRLSDWDKIVSLK